MIPSFLATAVRLTAGLSEFALLLNTWIISFPTDNDSQHPYKWLLPTPGNVVFAISEPLYMFFLVRLPIEPAFLALVVPVSQLLTTMLLWDVTGAVELGRKTFRAFVSHTCNTQRQQLPACSSSRRRLMSRRRSRRHCMSSWLFVRLCFLVPRGWRTTVSPGSHDCRVTSVRMVPGRRCIK
jgi:hypothetical protein